jgi:hypothetical protein
MGNEHISFTTSKIGSLLDVQSSKDPEGLRIFYYLVQVCLLNVWLRLARGFTSWVIVLRNSGLFWEGCGSALLRTVLCKGLLR